MASFLIPTATFTFFLFLLFPSPTIVNGVVVDVDGEIIPNGSGKYYMQPFLNPIGAGPIGWVSEKNTCPLTVTKTAFTEESRKSTITLASPFLSMFIPEGPIFIHFNDEDTPCGTTPLTWFIKPEIGIFVRFLELGAGTHDLPLPSFSLIIEDADIEGRHVYQLKYCQPGGCRYIVENPDNSGFLGIEYGNIGGDLKPFQFELQKAESSLKMRI